MDARAYFKGKRITVMGLGLLGRGVGDAQYLAECGAELIVTDLKTHRDLEDSVVRLKPFPNIKFIFGEHRLEDFRDRDLILKAAGVPLDSPYVAEAKKNGIPVRMSADLFAEISGVPVIGVTGTRGKSTVVHMLHTVLTEAGVPVLLGGNVRGVSNLTLLSNVTSSHIAVLELDSWQCHGFGEVGISPHIAVFTTFYPDHLNYYKNNLDTYLADKANIFLHQTPKDTLVLGAQCAPIIIDRYGDDIVSKILVVDMFKYPDTWTLRIPGTHNRYAAALALVVARAVGISDDISHYTLESFNGVPGRLEFIEEKNGVKIYNDTTATTPEATLAALSAFDIARTILIMGGTSKGLDMSALMLKLPEVKHLVLLAGNGTDRIRSELPNAHIYNALPPAIDDALAHASIGDTILFSPAFSSFGMFKNEFDRGDQFTTLVRNR